MLVSLKKEVNSALAPVAQWVECRPHKAEGRQFDSRSGHKPGLRVWSQVGMRVRGNQSMFLTLVFLSLSPSLPLSLEINRTFKKEQVNSDTRCKVDEPEDM